MFTELFLWPLGPFSPFVCIGVFHLWMCPQRSGHPWLSVRVWECISNSWLHTPVHGHGLFIERVTSWPSHWGDSPDNRNGRFFSYWDESSNLPPGLEQGGVHLHVDVPAAGQKWRWARGAPHSSACRLSFNSLFSALLFTPDFGSAGISEYGPFLLNFLYFSEYGCEWWWWKQTWGSSRSTHRLPMLLSLAPGGSPSGAPQGSCRESCFLLLFAQCQYLGCSFFHFINSAAMTPSVSLSPKLIEISHLFSFPLLYNLPLLD